MRKIQMLIQVNHSKGNFESRIYSSTFSGRFYHFYWSIHDFNYFLFSTVHQNSSMLWRIKIQYSSSINAMIETRCQKSSIGGVWTFVRPVKLANSRHSKGRFMIMTCLNLSPIMLGIRQYFFHEKSMLLISLKINFSSPKIDLKHFYKNFQLVYIKLVS